MMLIIIIIIMLSAKMRDGRRLTAQGYKLTTRKIICKQKITIENYRRSPVYDYYAPRYD